MNRNFFGGVAVANISFSVILYSFHDLIMTAMMRTMMMLSSLVILLLGHEIHMKKRTTTCFTGSELKSRFNVFDVIF